MPEVAGWTLIPQPRTTTHRMPMFHGPSGMLAPRTAAHARRRLAAVDEARPDSQWHANALWLQSAAHLLLGNLETADDILAEAVPTVNTARR